jgi:hypothetical protein
VDLQFNFVADRIVRNKAYPAFAQHCAEPYTPEWRQFMQHWPNTVPVELHEHCATHDFPHNLYSIDNYPPGSYYTVGLGFFNFFINYFGLFPGHVQQQLRSGNLKVLFYYHEGDNPYRIKEVLDKQCRLHQLPVDCYRFVSGNTEADKIPGFAYFPDHELLYWHRNQEVPATPINMQPRRRIFTALSRTHKWWRATVMADLVRNGLLYNSYWSYNTDVALNEPPTDNPIEVDTLNVRSAIDEFLKGAPYTCDSQTSDQHNDHSIIETDHYTDAYCNIVLETHYDADQSAGAFLTEKTFKPIKHGQPFVIVGCPGSLEALRNLGYKTFDHVIDNSYDLETDNTRRWQKLLTTIRDIQQRDLLAWFELCRADIEHNQNLFASSKHSRLNNLLTKLNS